MTIREAIESCKEGNFVTNLYFDSEQSMHMYNDKLYYEDGAVVPEDFIHNESWAIEDWKIKHAADKVDKNKLSELHENSRGMMLNTGSYEDCIIK